MTDFAKLVLDADSRGLRSGERDLDSLSSKAKRTAGDVDVSAGKMAQAFKGFGLALAGIGIADMALSFGKASVSVAIDAQEMQSAFNTVFGNMADDVRTWAETTGDALGRSTQEIQRGVLAFQELFGKALAPEQAIAMSQQFAVLTQQLASFKNLSNEVAQQKLFSGLIGEAEPLRAVGVLLSETAVQAKAAQLGLGGVNGALTEQEKIVVRAAIIQDQLIQAQGDIERTSGSAANQIKSMNAAVEELQVAVGDRLLPALTPLISATAYWVDVMAKAAQSIGTATTIVGDFTRGLGILGDKVSAAAAALGFDFVGGLSRAGSEIYAFSKKMIPAIGYLEAAVGLISKLGRDAREAKGFAQSFMGMPGGFSNTFDRITASFQQAQAAARITSGAFQGVGVGVASIGGAMRSSASEARKSADSIKSDIDGIMGRLFPLQTQLASLNKDMAALGLARGKIGDSLYVRAQTALEQQAAAIRSEMDYGAILPADMIPQLFADPLAQFRQSLGWFAKEAENTSVRVAQTFQDMATKTLDAFSRVTSAIQGGGFLGILQSVIGLGFQLGGLGVFGKDIAAKLNKTVPGFANGTDYAPGGLALVGEHGPEFVNLPRGSKVWPNGTGPGGGGQPIVFDLRGAVMTEDLLRQMNAIGVQAAVQGGHMGSDMAMQRFARRRQRSARGGG